MRPLITLSARWVLVASALVLTIACAGGCVRVLPWVLAREVPFALIVPFAHVLASRGLELSVLVGLPTGIAIAAALFVERGEARALHALGAGPSALVAGLVPLGLLAIMASALLAGVAEAPPPGRFAAGLLEAGRSACADEAAPRRVDVPLLSLAWLCFEPVPRLVGAVPGLHGGFWFTGRALRPESELHALRIEDLRFVGAVSGLKLALHANDARLSGLPGWGHSRRVDGTVRGALVGVVAVVTALCSAWAIVRAAIAQPLWAVAASGAASLLALAAIRFLDGNGARAPLYGLILPSGGLSALLLFFLMERGFRWHVAGRKA
jgi:hypothetical protein